MFPLLATIKPTTSRGWNHYARVLLEGGSSQGGMWKYLNGPFFPFSLDTPNSKSGIWQWQEEIRQIFFFASEEFGQKSVMKFARVPQNFRVLCSMRDATGPGARDFHLTHLDSELMTWVMGPGGGKPKRRKDPVPSCQVCHTDKYRDSGPNEWWGRTGHASCSSTQGGPQCGPQY